MSESLSRDPVHHEHMRRLGLAALIAAVASVTACGGGGGGGGSTPPPPGPAVQTTVTGTATFESVPNNSTTAALEYASATFQPIRGATVELVSGTTTLTTGVTDASGAYSLGPVTTNGPVFVRVRAELKRTAATGGTYDFSVRDNTSGNAMYVLDSPAFTPASANESRSVSAASGWGGTSYTGTRAAGPFAILDVAYRTTQKVLSVAPNQVFPQLTMYWSPNNRPASGGGGIPAGNIGTSFFSNSGGTRALYLLGAANTDTDEYDTHVVAHEWGHFFQNALSRDDSVGGPHTGGDKLDMRVAFSEGWGNAWSGMALGSPLYADSNGSQQAGGFVIDVSQRPSTNLGWFSEDTVQYLMYTWHQSGSIGFGPIFSALTGALRTSSVLSAIHNFSTQLKLAAPGGASVVNTTLGDQLINATDEFGTGETNNGGVALSLPIYNNWVNNTTQYCVTSAAGTVNKIGQFKYVRLNFSGTRTITVTAVSPATATDPDIELVKSDGSVAISEGVVVNSETLTTALPAGIHTLVFTDFNLQSGASTGQRCFTVNVQ